MKIVLITGGPFSGKGTQSELLQIKTGYKHISVGEYCRTQKQLLTPLGIKLNKFKKNGGLIPPTLIKEIVTELIRQNKLEKGIILEGYPITVEQVYDFIEIVKRVKLDLIAIYFLQVSKENLLVRGKQRSTKSNRIDDKHFDIREERINFYFSTTVPAINLLSQLFSNNFIAVDGNNAIQEISAKIHNFAIY